MSALRFVACFRRPFIASGPKRMFSTHHPQLISTTYPVRRLMNVDVAFADEADVNSKPNMVYSIKLVHGLIVDDRATKEKQNEKERMLRDSLNITQAAFAMCASFVAGVITNAICRG